MSEQESWEEECDGAGSGKDDPEKGPVDAPADPTPDNATTPTADRAQTQELTKEPDSPTAANLDTASRAKRAQRTRRMKLPGTTQQSHQTANQNPPPPNNPTNQTQGNQPANQENSNSTNRKPAKNASPTANPIQIPPQIIAFNDGEDTDEDFPRDDEPSKILAGLCCVAGGMVNAVHGLCHLMKGLAHAIAKLIFAPVVFGAFIYCSMVYMIVSFLIDKEDLAYMDGFEASLKYILSNAIWAVLPIFASFLAIHFNSNNKHHQFLYESVIDSMLLMANSLIMTSHAGPECLVWLGPIYVVSALFRFLYWASLFHLQTKWQQIFRTPTILNCVILSVFNLGVSLQVYAGGFLGGVTPDHVMDEVTPSEPPPTSGSATPGGQGWF